MQRPIYLDYAATTPIDKRVAEKMANYLTLDGEFGNPASTAHIYGWQAEEAVAVARRDVAALINAEPREIVWTSGATESDNLAIKGVAYFYRDKGNHIITVSTEHKAVLDTCAQLEREGFVVTYLKPQPDGLIDLDVLRTAITDKTLLVSVMHVNNETGVVQDIAAIGALVREKGAFFHVDAAQSAGKLPLDVKQLDVDLISFSAHKAYGPKGIGALYVRHKPRVRLIALIHGGGHEGGVRSGTLATHQIVGMGHAFKLAAELMTLECTRITALRDRLWQGLSTIAAIYRNGHPDHCSPQHLNVSFDYVEGEALLMALEEIAVSSASACNSTSIEPSHVLHAMGIKDELAHSAIRFSLGRFTTEGDIDAAIAHVKQVVAKLRAMSPLWEAYLAHQQK